MRLIGWGSTDPEGLKRLTALLEDECYYDFLSKIEELKFALTESEEVRFDYHHGDLQLSRVIQRDEFDHNVQGYMNRAKQILQTALDESRVSADEIEAVFLTGGSSQVPAFRRMIETVFDPSIIHTKDFFTSVAEGLATFGTSLEHLNS